jgi:hypothetical protein
MTLCPFAILPLLCHVALAQVPVQAQVYFSPEGQPTKAIVEVLDGAKKSVLV